MEKTMSVQVKKGQVRKSPSFIAAVVAEVSYGGQVAVRGEKGPWVHVFDPRSRAEGWMHASALTARKVVLQSGGTAAPTSVSGDELALAGKGFNQQVEEAFKRKNPQLDFTWVDRMEAQVVSPDDMRRFLADGQLRPEGGER